MGLLSPANSLSIYRGSTKTLELTVNKAELLDEDGNPIPVVLSTVKLIFSVKSCLNDKPALIQKTTDSAAEILITKPSAGKAKIFLLPVDTQHLEAGIYSFDIWLFFLVSGSRYVIVAPSQFEVKQAVSYVPL